ncbi:MAG: exodeoxyribonuclease VII large subunit [Lachnospiraceae bacterium]|nr:exodeoxyribonuclease VII large subunit [Lachnospiraceae bacterium]
MQKIYSVGQINSYIKNMFTQDFVLNRVSISGEVSNCKYHSSGHIYFSLKDETGTLACVMFASARRGLAFRLSDGLQVIVDGNINVYERDGRYQLYASHIRRDGAGALYERFLELKQELEDMGMFSPEYKQPIPPYVRRLGVVTAPTGAAVRDIINISRRRSPGIQLILYPAKVQGEGAAASVADGLRALDRLGLDAIIVGRGGGSIEDLWAFNEETVARAIFECETPVISAVGHETDTTIADFVADLRAPTPSAAAELAVPDTAAIAEQLAIQRAGFERLMQNRISENRMRYKQYQLRLGYASPMQRLREQRQHLSDLEEGFGRGMNQLVEARKQTLILYAERLKSVSPLEKLTQGFACVTDQDGKRVYSAGQVKVQDAVSIYVSDGVIEAEVTKTAKTQTIQTGGEQ